MVLPNLIALSHSILQTEIEFYTLHLNYPRYFIKILILPLSRNLMILFSRIWRTRSRVRLNSLPIAYVSLEQKHKVKRRFMRQLKISKSITNRSSEALDKYLVEIGREPMVSIDEEIELAQKIRKGGREGERAKEKLVKANLRFVVSVAKQYQHQGLGLTDLIDEGNIGLVKAAEKFDETRGFKFISYEIGRAHV